MENMTSDESEIKLVFFDDLHCHLRESSQSVVAKSINSGGRYGKHNPAIEF